MAVDACNRSNKFVWNDYKAPRWPLDNIKEPGDSALVEDPTASEAHNFPSSEKVEEENSHSFTLRHLKQGATGAYKTWPAAEVLLDYLVRYGGILLQNKHSTEEGDTLDLTCAPPEREELLEIQGDQPQCYNILELGAGSGYLGIGLALSLNAQPLAGGSPKLKVLCTDMDKPTIKNMRQNVTARQINKTVRVEPLSWGEEDINQPKFLAAVQALFKDRKKASPNSTTSETRSTSATADSAPKEEVDPIRLLTHLIGSDVHYGETTLEPLSSVVAAVKLRNPNVQVILLMKERSTNSIAQLKLRIEDKVALQGFSVRMRDVLHKDVTTVKILEF